MQPPSKQTRVLRIFYVENVFTGMVENRKDKSRLEAHFKNFQRCRDYPETCRPSVAIEEIKSRFVPLEGRYDELDKIKPYVDAFSWKIVDLVEVVDKWQPKSEKIFEESLLPPVMLADCNGVKPRSRK